MRLAAIVVLASTRVASADVSITATSGPVPAPNNTYAPANVVAVWVEDQAGAFVKTIDRRAAVRKVHLVAWNQQAGANDNDAVTGASRIDHGSPISMTWDLRDRAGNVVPDGTYTIRMELAEENSTLATQNNQGTFTFVKSASPQTQTGLSNGGFTSVSIDFQPIAQPPDEQPPEEEQPDEIGGDIEGGCNASGNAAGLVAFVVAGLVVRRRRA
jgi:uncharacterized protein (TIGR03382 family)